MLASRYMQDQAKIKVRCAAMLFEEPCKSVDYWMTIGRVRWRMAQRPTLARMVRYLKTGAMEEDCQK
jgi:hypothetical protein